MRLRDILHLQLGIRLEYSVGAVTCLDVLNHEIDYIKGVNGIAPARYYDKGRYECADGDVYTANGSSYKACT